MAMKMKVGEALRRILPAFENVPRNLLTDAGMDYERLLSCDVVGIEITYSLDPVPADQKISFVVQPVIDATKVTLGATDETNDWETRKSQALEVLRT